MFDDVLLQAGLRFLFWVIAIGVGISILSLFLALYIAILMGLGGKNVG